MPVVINEVEVLPERPPTPKATGGSTWTPATEPTHEQLRRLQRDLEGRAARRRAD